LNLDEFASEKWLRINLLFSQRERERLREREREKRESIRDNGRHSLNLFRRRVFLVFMVQVGTVKNIIAKKWLYLCMHIDLVCSENFFKRTVPQV
jgi:hypothetical protein